MYAIYSNNAVYFVDQVSTKNTHVRWAFNPRMLLQFTDCIAQQMDSDGAITGEFAITYDIWLKVNNGIRQR